MMAETSVGAKDEMKSKPIFTIVISTLVIASLVIWAYMAMNKEASEPVSVKVASKANPENSTGHQWFSDVPLTASKIDPNNLVPIVDADGSYVDLKGLTVSQYVKTLYSAANNGDKKAAFNIYSAESVCARIPQMQRDLSALPTNTEQHTIALEQDRINAAKAICTDFSISSKERLDYLTIAAKGGVALAQISFGLEPPEGVDVLDRTDPRANQWVKEAGEYLVQAAMQGNTVALQSASTFYESGTLVPKDIPLALSYELASMAILRAEGKNAAPNLENLSSPVITRLSNQLTPDQVRSANAAAQQLINHIRSK